MSVSFKAPENIVLKPIITVFGIGGAGGNAVNNMIAANLQGANFVVANTDAQSLEHSLCDNRIQLGATITKGLGAGAAPEVGALAAEESVNEIMGYLEGSNMVFITAGMGGGTGTGASPVIARIAKELGILTVGVVTKPFHFEGAHRMKTADKGLNDLQQFVDTLIVIPNQNLFRIANERTTFADAFKMADDVLHAGVRGVTDLMIMPGLINLDFADIRTIMSEMGKAMMGTGEASGEDRAVRAAEAAISNPLLDHTSMRGARGVLINITGGSDMTLFEVDNAANRIREEVGGDSEANIIFGSTFNPELNGIIRVSVVATGIDAENHVAHIKPTYATTKASSLEETISPTATIVATPTISPTTVYEEEVPQFGNYTMTDGANIVHPAVEPLIHTTNTAFRTTEMPGSGSPQNHSNSRSSLLSKMWNSLKSNDKVRTADDIDYHKDQVAPSTGSASNNIHEIPAFLRKQQK